ncbi:unnamed protein product [Tilletia controversa]|nr:unnamed protein product [Tilletia controversa]CAD6962115.1 unnamed protein product [Tilletia controversa]CAD6978716.1 unnamed protein product [Tilletia controversa]CAD6980948.1 unnamed protein product [Tilletia controversa]
MSSPSGSTDIVMADSAPPDQDSTNTVELELPPAAMELGVPEAIERPDSVTPPANYVPTTEDFERQAAARPHHSRAASTNYCPALPTQASFSGSPFIYPIRSAVKVRPSTTASDSGSFTTSNKSLDSTHGGGHSRGMSVALPSPSDIGLSSSTSMDSRSPSAQSYQMQYYSHQLGASPPSTSQAGFERALSQRSASNYARSHMSSASSVASSNGQQSPQQSSQQHHQSPQQQNQQQHKQQSPPRQYEQPGNVISGLQRVVSRLRNETANAGENGSGSGSGSGSKQGQTIVNVDCTAPLAQPDSPPSSATGFSNPGDREWEGQTTMRFTHVETEEGHMVLTGRDGELMRCEDEPIHIPGAIQSFGCMLVVREDEEGALVVRQCSENTSEILSLTPAYLFSLPNFLDCMDEDQADVLWDNIESLNETPEELNETGPTVFRLHGWGQPGHGAGKARGRKHWDAWCAAHRPEGARSDGEPSLIILEFELINDPVNPRDPPSQDPLQEKTLHASFSKGTTPASSDVEELVDAKDQVDDDGLAIPRRGSGATEPRSYPISEAPTADSDRTVRPGAGQAPVVYVARGGLEGQPYSPDEDDVVEATQSSSKPLKALARLRLSKRRTAHGDRRRRPGAGGPGFGAGVGPSGDSDDISLDMFGILSQANEQLAAQSDLASFLKVAVGIVREITTFSRVMIYQFDEHWNGQVVCELVNWSDTHDLYRGLHFPASDIPAQARAMYRVNKIRLLYDRSQTTSRMVCRDSSDLGKPVDMTHCYLRAMSPIHIKYLENMGVRASMSISIIAFDQLWGLVALHTYGDHGKRVSFPIRQLSRLIGDSISRNIERLSYTRRLSARKLINTLSTDKNPSGYIISNAEDLLTLFDADFGIIAIGLEAKILGPLDASQEVLAITEYLRIKQFDTVVTSSEMLRDFPDMIIPTTLRTIAGLLVVPLTPTGGDFIAFLRKTQIRQVNWAGKPFKEGREGSAILDPRKSFKKWSETVEGTCRGWKDEELETASVLCLIYGKFISVWQQREQAIQHNQMNKLLLSNASHEVRTPLNHIINYLELALDGPLDTDTRDNLSRSHLASKSLLFVINDLLDLTRQEEGKRLYLQEPFDLGSALREAVEMHESEAKRRMIHFSLEVDAEPCTVLGDKNKVRQIVVNSVTNAVSHTKEGQITVAMTKRTGADMTTSGENCNMEAEIVISDTGEGIPKEKLEAIFREFEEVESVLPGNSSAAEDEAESALQRPPRHGVLGLGLAINARIVKNLGGQLRVQSTVGEGSRFAYIIPFCMQPAQPTNSNSPSVPGGAQQMRRSGSRSSAGSGSSAGRSEIDSLVEALNAPHLGQESAPARQAMESPVSTEVIPTTGARTRPPMQKQVISHDFGMERPGSGSIPITGSSIPLRPVRIDSHDLDAAPLSPDYFHHESTSPTGIMDGSADSSAVASGSRRNSLRSNGSKGSNPRTTGTGTGTGNGTEAREASSVVRPRSSHSQAKMPASGGVASASTSPPASPPVHSALDPVGTGSGLKSGGGGVVKKRVNWPKMGGSHASSKPSVPPLRALVVEDDPINAAILKKRLLLDRHSVVVSVNGEEAVQEFLKRSDEIDLVLMDLQMPICNGRDACRRIRSIEKERGASRGHANRPASHVLNGGVPILAVSATLTEDMRSELHEIGFDGWVLKPIDFGRLAHLMKGITDVETRTSNLWVGGYIWERGGWLHEAALRSVS